MRASQILFFEQIIKLNVGKLPVEEIANLLNVSKDGVIEEQVEKPI